MSEYLERLAAWWRWLWTGYGDEAALRRHLECEVHRFGGTVSWLPKSRR